VVEEEASKVKHDEGWEVESWGSGNKAPWIPVVHV
jgi:hypothetical protein